MLSSPSVMKRKSKKIVTPTDALLESEPTAAKVVRSGPEGITISISDVEEEFQVRDYQKERDFLKSLSTEILQQNFFEKSLYRLADLSVGTLITIKGIRIETGGKFGDYPVIKCDFNDMTDVELALPSRYNGKVEKRELPLYMVYAGTCDYQGKTLQRAEFINMKYLKRAMDNM